MPLAQPALALADKLISRASKSPVTVPVPPVDLPVEVEIGAELDNRGAALVLGDPVPDQPLLGLGPALGEDHDLRLHSDAH